MFGIVFKNLNGCQEMAIRRLFSTRKSAEVTLRALTANLGPSLQARYSIAELTFV